MKKPSEFLGEFASHGIYDANEASQDYEKETGRKAPWPSHSAQELREAIVARGLGGELHSERPGVAGYEMAEAVAKELCSKADLTTMYRLSGRGSRHREGIAALARAGF